MCSNGMIGGTNPGTDFGTVGRMPALNVTFSDAEMEQLRTAAAAGELSLRAFVHRAALDAASEQSVLLAVRAAADAGAVVLVVAHRPAMLAIADQVVMIHGGGR